MANVLSFCTGPDEAGALVLTPLVDGAPLPELVEVFETARVGSACTAKLSL